MVNVNPVANKPLVILMDVLTLVLYVPFVIKKDIYRNFVETMLDKPLVIFKFKDHLLQSPQLLL